MSSTHAQIQFAAEFVTLMIAAAGVALSVLRPEGPHGRRRPAERFLIAVGFLATATAAFLRGSLLLTGNPGGALSIVRLSGAGLLLIVTLRWSGWVDNRRFYLLGLAAWVGAAVAELVQASTVAVDIVLVAGSLAIGLALLAASRRSIAARVAASAAATLLLVIVVVAVALSAVISSSLQRDELRRLSSTASTESSQILAQVNYSQAASGFAEVTIASTGGGADTSTIQRGLTSLRTANQLGGFAYAPADGSTPVATQGVTASIAATLAHNPAFNRLSCAGHGAGVFVVADSAFAAAAYPLCSKTAASSGTLLGTVLYVDPLDGTYLQHTQPDQSLSIALVSPTTVLATTGPEPDLATLLNQAASPGKTAATANRFYAAAAVNSTTTPVAVVVSTSASTVLTTRTQLYRTLFLIALGGTILALALAAFTGDRITAGVRRLTNVAARIEAGESSERAGIPGDDEVSRLGSAFDSMVGAVEEQAAALQAAADDETRLRNRLEAIVAGMTDALIAVDDGGFITDFNRAAEELLGVRADIARGRSVVGLISIVGEDGVGLAEQLVDLQAQPWGALASVRRTGRVDVPVAVSSGALMGPAGEAAGRVVVMRDLRREREVEQMKTEFLSRIGHELRTPLTGIMGYADILLRRDVTADRAKQFNDEILQAGRRLLRIVEMLEFFASSGAGRVLLRPEPVDTRALINGLTAAWTERLPDNVTLGRRVAKDTPDVYADRRWISLAIEELIDNAIKFSPDGGRVVVGAAPAGEHNGNPPDSVEISITDRGIGMSDDEAAHIFTDFVQGDASDTRRFGGLGLGLAVVQRVVEGHGGQVHCRSATGRGSTFTIVLPVAAPARAIAHSEPSPVLG